MKNEEAGDGPFDGKRDGLNDSQEPNDVASNSPFSILPFPLSILYEEGPCLAVNKPGGLLTQAPRGIDSLEWQVKTYLMKTEGRGENGYLGVPHRLDRPVSGVILFGKHSRATRRLSEQFEARTIDKTYWAVVQGHLETETGIWTDYMRKIPGQALAEIVSPINPDAREAILRYTVLRRLEFEGQPFSLLEVKLETGRMHQIRLQASVHGHPILGDATYGSMTPFGEHFEDERRREIALHSLTISFEHPMTRESVLVTAPLPPLWEKLGIRE